MRSFWLVVAVVFGITAAAAQDRAADEKAIRAVSVAFEKAINQRDFAALGALYATDADLIVQDSTIASGRAAIQAATQRDWTTIPNRRISLTVTNVRFVSNDVAIVNTRAEFNEGPVKEDRGTWVAVRQRNGGLACCGFKSDACRAHVSN